MRVIDSSWESADPDVTLELADTVRAVVERAHADRETYTEDEGQRAHEVTLKPYADSRRESRWAVVLSDPSGYSIRDSADRDEAEAAYEQEVRGLAGCAEFEPWWQVSDVMGIALSAYSWEVEYQDADGMWSHAGRYGGQGESRLSGRAALGAHTFAAFTLQEAVSEMISAVVGDQENDNATIMLASAAGDPSVTAALSESYAVRVSVAGTGTDGTCEFVEERTLPRPAAPTADEIAAYCAVLQQVSHELERYDREPTAW
ncbi:hypothetical protein ACWDG9_17070 [Streptomyces sp. NPDC001073]